MFVSALVGRAGGRAFAVGKLNEPTNSGKENQLKLSRGPRFVHCDADRWLLQHSSGYEQRRDALSRCSYQHDRCR